MTSREQIMLVLPLITQRLKNFSFTNAVKTLEVAVQFQDGSISAKEVVKLGKIVELSRQLMEVFDEDEV